MAIPLTRDPRAAHRTSGRLCADKTTPRGGDVQYDTAPPKFDLTRLVYNPLTTIWVT
jgi:hypothetical protein